MKKFVNKLKPYWPILVILFASLILLRSFFKPGFPETHDGQLHLARLANFHLAVVDRHFPIRWARNLNYKFGYPVFHFNYFTPYILALVPKFFLGVDFETGFKFAFTLSLFTGGLFWYLLFKKKLGQLPASLAALIYVSAPYQLVNILVRGSVGEIVALGLFPFLFWSINWLVNRPSRLSFLTTTLGLAGLALTHNISYFFGVPILGIYALILIYQKKDWSKLRPVILSFAFSVSLTLFFWAPALMEKKFTNLDALDMSYQYVDHFPSLSQLIYSPWGYGFSNKGLDDGLSFQLGPLHWLAAILSIIFLAKSWFKSKKLNWSWLFFFIVFLGSIIMMMPASLPIWKVLPMVRYIQFPWRLLGFSIMAVAALTAYLAQKLPKTTTVLVIGAFLYTAAIAKPGGWFDWDNYFYYEYPFTSSIMGLNMPKWFDLNKNHTLKLGNMFDLRGVSSIKEISWKTQKHVYEIDAPQDTEILERTAYFPGWEVEVDGQPVTIDYQKTEYPGAITFKIPAGKHTIVTRFTENTPARRIGDAVSLVSVIAFVALIETGWFIKKKS